MTDLDGVTFVRLSDVKLPRTIPTLWGEWELVPELYVLVHHAGYGYEIDLETCTSSAEVLDWIFQINGKTWATDLTVHSLIEALRDTLHPQARLCSNGTPKKLTPAEIRQYIDARIDVPESR